MGGGGGMGLNGMGAGGMSYMDLDPVSNVRLPPVKQLVDIETPVVQKVYINSTKRTRLFSNEVLVNVMCRFGQLISASWLPGESEHISLIKRFIILSTGFNC